MTGLTPEAAILLRKELRQVLRSRGALISTTVLPLLMLVVIPVAQLSGIRAAYTRPAVPTNIPLPPGFADLQHPVQLLLHVGLPFLAVIGGLLVPAIGTTYTIVTERERRTLELLVALPVRITDILVAKLGAIVLMALAIVVPLYAVQATFILVTRTAGPAYVVLLFLVLLGALACSTGIALLLTLLAKDFRTANNLNGLFILPVMLITVGTLISVPGDTRLAVLAAVLLGLAGLAVVAASRWLTFERYLS